MPESSGDDLDVDVANLLNQLNVRVHIFELVNKLIDGFAI